MSLRTKNRFPTSKYRFLWLIPALITLVYLLAYANPLASSAYPGIYTAGYRSAIVQETDYDWPAWEASNDYGQHLDIYFQLYVKEAEGRLRLHIPNIPNIQMQTTLNKVEYTVGVQDVEYNTVTQPDDCALELFLDNYDRDLDYEQGAANYLSLNSSDYNRYHCFKVTLDVDRQLRRNPRPRRIFVTRQPIAAASVNNDLGDYPGFSQAVMQNTYYHYKPGVFIDSLSFRPDYYNHLDSQFNLYYRRQADGRFALHIRKPLGLVANGMRDIRPFSLEKFNYATVAQQSECGRSTFEDSPRERTPSPSLSLTPSDDDLGGYYCLKVGIQSAIPGRRDLHPYRIFFVPQEIVQPDIMPTSATSRHWARLLNN